MILEKSAGTACENRGQVRRSGPRVLIINPFGIGDILFTTPVIRALKEAYPDSFIGYWCNARVSPLLLSNPKINRIFALSRGDIKKLFQESFSGGLAGFFKLILALKHEQFDICLDYSLDHRYGLLAGIAGIKKRIGFNYKNRGRFLTDKIDLTGYSDKHAVEYYLKLLKFLDIEPKDKSLDLPVSAQASAKAADILAAGKIEEGDILVGIAAGAGGSWGKDAAYKHWPALKFAQVGQRLAERLGAKVVLLGDDTEKPIADVISNAMRNKPLDLTGKLGLDLLPAVIKNCSLFISNDGGPMHIAAALGIKTVSIFGPVSEEVYGPYPARSGHVVLKRDLDCRPCYKNFRMPVCDKDKECLRAISVDAVFEAAAQLLRQGEK